MKHLFVFLLALFCESAQAGEIQDIFRSEGDSDIEFTNYERGPGDHGITEIGIERTICFGTCPIYTFIAKSDGTFRYVGEQYVSRIGSKTGKIDSWQFDRLAKFITETDFMQLRRGYSAHITDHPSVYIMVVMNGERKVVYNYANAGPAELWAIASLIDQLMDQATWD